MNKMEIIKALLCDESPTVSDVGHKSKESFFTIGKVYAFRTVTMIYTGRLVSENETQFLVDEAAWIPDTERWADFVDTGAHKEAEPYKRPVVLFKGAMLDITEIPSVIGKQK